MFSTLPNTNFDFLVKIILSSANDMNLDCSKILSFGKELKPFPKQALGQYSSTILKNVLSLVLQIFLYLVAFECNTTLDGLNHMI